MKIARYIGSVVLAWCTIAFGIEVFTVPAFVATPYILLMVVCGVLTWIVWPRKRKTTA